MPAFLVIRDLASFYPDKLDYLTLAKISPMDLNALIVMGLGRDANLYSWCKNTIEDLLSHLLISRKNLLLLPGPESPYDFRKLYILIRKQAYEPEKPDIISQPDLQIIVADTDTGFSHEAFEAWDRRANQTRIGRTNPARILVTTRSASHWSSFPETTLESWRIKAPLFELCLQSPRKLTQPFSEHLETLPKTAQFFNYDTQQQVIEPLAKLTAPHEAIA